MSAVRSPKKTSQLRSSKSSGSQATSQSLPLQWKRSRKNEKSFPLLIRVLLFLQHTSSILTLSAIAGSLIMYGLTFYTQQMWNRQYDKLQELQYYERNVTSIHEALKDEIAEQAKTTNETFVPLTPDYNLYLEPAMISHSSETASSSQSRKVEPPKTDRPVAY
ncbi:MAG: hypothetical protein BRC33_00680 [Cyanobacteria bacterium SW_9_44_58]|nr:MAG: hypothetical protein BRC33_00680 [Cyanobacteria bacterium SW_9_44_58]